MTLAAGLECRDGLVFATDLELTQGVIKRMGAKSTHDTDNGKTVVLAGAGYYDVLAYACEQMIPKVKESDLSAIVGGLRTELYNVWRDHIDPFYPEQEKDGALQMIAGIIAPKHRGIYISGRSILRRDSNFAFVGYGAYLAYYLAKQKWTYDTTVEEGVEIVKWIVAEAGENVPTVGKIANITTVDLDGTSHFIPPS